MRYCPTCETEYDDSVVVCPNDEMRTVLLKDSSWDRYEGTVLDERWKLISILGEGGMGAVFRGEQTKIKREVAVKLIKQELASDQAILSRFFREAQVLSNLQHPHVVKLFDFGQDKHTQTLYLVMELLRGQSLDAWIGPDVAQSLSLKQVLQFAQQLASALAEAHSQGVVHRDLKPENLFLRETLGGGVHLVVIDFGIAKVEDESMTKLTQTGFIQGTPYYMAPEQIEGRSVTPSSDLYSMGVILYEVLAGAEPFQGDSAMQIFMQHLTQPAEPLAGRWALADPIFEPLIDLVDQLMSKKPEDRPQNALEVQNECEAMLAYLNAQDSPGAGPNTYQRLRQYTDPPPAQTEPEAPPSSTTAPERPAVAHDPIHVRSETPNHTTSPQSPRPTSTGTSQSRKGILVGVLCVVLVLGGVGAAYMSGAFSDAPTQTQQPTSTPTPPTVEKDSDTPTPTEKPTTKDPAETQNDPTPSVTALSETSASPATSASETSAPAPRDTQAIKRGGTWSAKTRKKPVIPVPDKAPGTSPKSSQTPTTKDPKKTPAKKPSELKGILNDMRNL